MNALQVIDRYQKEVIQVLHKISILYNDILMNILNDIKSMLCPI